MPITLLNDGNLVLGGKTLANRVPVDILQSQQPVAELRMFRTWKLFVAYLFPRLQVGKPLS